MADSVGGEFGNVHVPVISVVLFRQAFEKVLPAARGAGTELDGVDAGAVVAATDVGELGGRELGVLGIGEKENDVGPEAERQLQSLYVLRAAVRQDAADEFLGFLLASVAGELH